MRLQEMSEDNIYDIIRQHLREEKGEYARACILTCLLQLVKDEVNKLKKSEKIGVRTWADEVSDGTVRVEVWTPLGIVVRESANLPISFAVDAVEVHCDAVEGKLVLRVGGAPKVPSIWDGCARGGSRK